MFNMKQIPNHVFMRTDDPKEGCLFITHRGGNEHQTPYLIVKDNGYKLLNLHSYRMGYYGDSVESLIENYLKVAKGEGLNPVTHYFFARRWHSEINVDDTFGWVETGFKKISPKEVVNELKMSLKTIDKSNE